MARVSSALAARSSGSGSVRRAPHPDGRDHGHAQLAEQGIVARAVDQHGIARLRQVPHEQVERMIGPVREQDLRWRHLDRALAQHDGDALPQRRIAVWGRISLSDRPLPKLERTQMAAQLGALHPRLRRTPITDPDRIILLELLPQQPDMVDRFRKMRRTGIPRLAVQVTDIEAGSPLGPDIAHRDEMLVGFHQRVPGDAIFRRPRPDGRETFPRLHETLLDQRADFSGEFLGKAVRGLRMRVHGRLFGSAWAGAIVFVDGSKLASHRRRSRPATRHPLVRPGTVPLKR